MFGRRKFIKQMQRHLDERESEAIMAAREAVDHVVATFMKHPDVYAPKACIAARNPTRDSLSFVMFKLGLG